MPAALSRPSAFSRPLGQEEDERLVHLSACTPTAINHHGKKTSKQSTTMIIVMIIVTAW